MKLFRALLAVPIIFAAAFAFADEPVLITCEPAFGLHATTGEPLVVTLQNLSGDVRGVLTVSGDGGATHFAVDLPRGSTKRIFTYGTGAFDGKTVKFDAPHVNVALRYRPAMGTAPIVGQLLMISDTPGLGSYLRRTSSKDDEQGVVGNCAPADLPDRSAAYAGLTAIILGPGSERMSNSVADAIERFVVNGGALILTGGANQAIVTNPRWARIFPLKTLRQLNVSADSPNNSVFHSSISGPYTMLTGDPVDGTRVRARIGSNPLVSERGVGLGKVVFIGIDPNEKPFSGWEGRSAFFGKYTGNTDFVSAHSFRQYLEQSVGDQYDYSGSGLPTTSTWPAGRSGIAAPTAPLAAAVPLNANSDPFHVKLPSTERIFSILGLYFLAVVPLNFLILKKLKRGEWAWYSAPLVSLVFAGVLFKSAQALYGFTTSTSTGGAIVWSESAHTGTFLGYTKLFIAHSGTYDLGLANVEQIGSDSREYDYSGRPKDTAFDIWDNGRELQVPDANVGNLTYRGLSYRQSLSNKSMLQTKFLSATPSRVKVNVTNTTHWLMHSLTLWNGAQGGAIGDLSPGQSKTLTVQFMKRDQNTAYGDADVRALAFRLGQIVITASNVEGFRPGPQLGSEVPGMTQIGLIQIVDRPLAASSNAVVQ